MKLSTINQIVEWMLNCGDVQSEHLGDSVPELKERTKDMWKNIANEATIYLKTAMICENNGIDKAMEYFTGTHSEDEYQEFRTGVIGGDE